MQSAATLFCPNPQCQASNPEGHRFCQQCRTALPKHYLWAIGAGAESLRPGKLLGDRYWVKQQQIVLDTKPGLLPAFPDNEIAAIVPYLRLSPFQLHVPQVYGVVEGSRRKEPLKLLEQAPIYPEGVEHEATLMPSLPEQWAQSDGLRQLNWLWQIAQFWQPFSSEGVATSLLTPELLRVEGAIVRLLELRQDSKAPSLVDLGQRWQQWQPEAHPEISDFFKQLCHDLTQGEVGSAGQLVSLLDRALAACGATRSRQVQIATRTDKGPTRQRNEDACYPPDGTVQTLDATEQPLAIVCDGIGGHEGGNIASNLAIATVQKQIQALPQMSDSTAIVAELEQACFAANDVITQRNDSEQRQERQRMGTTIVLARVQAHELYLTHVGDSRAYRITRSGCHRVTVDDDLASREVRLGYALYRDALQQSGAGSLVQALGMGASSLLHPTVQQFVLDEDCLFLVCSDGLSDHDRVEEHWQTELLPVLTGDRDLDTASQRLVTIANQHNGHDNVTVALIYCQVQPGDRATPLRVAAAPAPATTGQKSPARTTKLLPASRRSHPLVRLVGILLLWGVGAALAYWFVPEVRVWVESLAGGRSDAPPVSSAPTPSSSPIASPTPSPLAIGSYLLVSRSPDTNSTASLQVQPGRGTPTAAIVGSLPVGSVLQISSRQEIPQQGYWLRLKVCSISTAQNGSARLAQPGESGWVPEATIVPLITPNLTPNTPQAGKCVEADPAPPRSTPRSPAPQAGNS